MTAVRHNPAKWSRNTQQAGADYAAGVQSPRVSWSQATEASEENYSAGVNDAIARGAFAKGVSKAGDAKWKRGVDEKGRTRFQQGAAVSQSDYDRGFAPFKSVIEGVTLAPRGPKGQNYGRVQAIGDALRSAKVAA